MKNTTQIFNGSAYIDILLPGVTDTETPDLATALLKALAKHIDSKTDLLRQRIRTFELRWKMTFEEFSERTRTGTLARHPHSYDMETDFKAWEQTVTLLKHYESLQTR